MKLKVPFKTWRILTERELDFIFTIGTLETATEEILKCDLWEVGDQNPYDVNVAILLAGYQIGCEKKRKSNIFGRVYIPAPKYNLHHAVFWIEHMSKDSQAAFLKAVQDLLGKMSKGKEKKK